jgi:hypothetical protein
VPGVSRPAAQVSALKGLEPSALGAYAATPSRTTRDTIMTATFHPQAAVDQARDAYRNVTALGLDTARAARGELIHFPPSEFLSGE